ncbi:unnamed protein product [Owenia fusiformis]|uniref:Uncharacterized protein n=1 Tax=Owenia fusiformis TaxID=6347 RepID=A0A8S4Q4C8_OWEFU|nr:unnamed protein product [Owenia fusiformis]
MSKMMKKVKSRVKLLSDEVLGLTKEVENLMEVSTTKQKSGRLSERMVKYASEVGFKSIISVFNFTNEYHHGDEFFPTTEDTKIVAESLAGIKFGIAHRSANLETNDWRNIRIVHAFTELVNVQQFPKPILVHSGVGYSASFYLLNYFANETRHNPSFEPKITARKLIKIGANFGFDFTNDEKLMEIVSETTGEKTSAITINSQDMPIGHDWYNYWEAMHVYKNIFIAGQIWSSHLQRIKEAGFSTIFNLRNGPAENSIPSQEEVTLLNIRDGTGTYEMGGRQSKKRLEETRIDASKPNEYISNTSMVNYESMNSLEFGDSIGYNEMKERMAIEALGIKYIHQPTVNDIKQAILMNSTQPVLIHSRTGHTAKLWALVTATNIWNLPESWAAVRLRK